MQKYDFFIAGRWRNREAILKITQIVRDAGFTAFCFLENDYTDFLKENGLDASAMESESTESMSLDHPLIKEIYRRDIEGQRASENFLVVLPAGIAAHMEAGVSFGMSKKCYAVGVPEKTETLYSIFEEIFEDSAALQDWLAKKK